MNREKIEYFIMLTTHQDDKVILFCMYPGNYKEKLFFFLSLFIYFFYFPTVQQGDQVGKS